MDGAAWKAYLDLKLASIDNLEDKLKRDPLDLGDKHPKYITPVERLREALFVLSELFTVSDPPVVQDRSKKVQVVRYGFGDASGSGLVVQLKHQTVYAIALVYGGLTMMTSHQISKNLKMLCREAASGNLNDAVLFLFTDNATVESAIYKGNSKSKELFLLNVRLKKIQVKCSIRRLGQANDSTRNGWGLSWELKTRRS
jgi:hypothetical protein